MYVRLQKKRLNSNTKTLKTSLQVLQEVQFLSTNKIIQDAV